MQRPSNRPTPPILLRAAHEWLNRVNHKRKQLAELGLSAGQQEGLERWTESEFVACNLRLEGTEISRERVAQLALASGDNDSLGDDESRAATLLRSLRKVSHVSRTKRQLAVLTPKFFLDIHPPRAQERFRVEAGDVAKRALDAACRWFTADSFNELHAIEQASIVMLRLLELPSFPEANEPTVLVAASLFTMRSELPPIIVTPETEIAYRTALDEGRQMNLKPLVELIAQSVERTINEMVVRV